MVPDGVVIMTDKPDHDAARKSCEVAPEAHQDVANLARCYLEALARAERAEADAQRYLREIVVTHNLLDEARAQLAAIDNNGWSVTFAVFDAEREFAIWTTVAGGLGIPIGAGPTLTDAIDAALLHPAILATTEPGEP